MDRLFHRLRKVIKSGCSPDEIRPFISEIERYTNLAMKYPDSNRKAVLIQLKGAALDYMLNIGKEFEEDYRNDLMEKLRN